MEKGCQGPSPRRRTGFRAVKAGAIWWRWQRGRPLARGEAGGAGLVPEGWGAKGLRMVGSDKGTAHRGWSWCQGAVLSTQGWQVVTKGRHPGMGHDGQQWPRAHRCPLVGFLTVLLCKLSCKEQGSKQDRYATYRGHTVTLFHALKPIEGRAWRKVSLEKAFKLKVCCLSYSTDQSQYLTDLIHF